MTTAKVTGMIFAVSIGLGSGRLNNFAKPRRTPSMRAPATCPPSSGGSGIRLNTKSATLSDAEHADQRRRTIGDRCRVEAGDLAGQPADADDADRTVRVALLGPERRVDESRAAAAGG